MTIQITVGLAPSGFLRTNLADAGDSLCGTMGCCTLHQMGSLVQQRQ